MKRKIPSPRRESNPRAPIVQPVAQRVLRRIYGARREEVVGGWRRLHNEELHNLYASSYIVGVTKSRRLRWAGHVVRIGDIRSVYKIVIGKYQGT
jgi:hypothetical protein